ncbi:DUF305 domain-containing protein [Cryomorpha ignava]|uniref:DUF305 domain-containing protein n=2 Tax=Cryomorpha ignava TaxID=101383 RepID=A0A7K3WQ95_9FLAO|nr:DUF305 domain-containing protein [Cryomorpha ignava]
MMKNNYLKFALMMACSFVFMYAAMFFNVNELDHIYISESRTFMAFYMVAPMAVIMLLFMLGMYTNKKINTLIIVGGIVVGLGAVFLLRTQTTVKDVQYMKAMIPHHSIAILVSENATFEDPETAKLAKEIIEAQKREIAQMERIIERLENEK